MAWNIVFAPLLPVWMIAAIGGVAALPLLYGLFRRLRGSLVRAAALVLLLLALANPSAIREERDPLADVVAVVVDRSASQAFAGRTELTDLVRGEVVAALDNRPNVELRVVESAPGADETRLFQALGTALADVPPERIAGALFITDGQVHDAPAAATGLAGGAPIHALLTGRENEIDRWIELVRAPRFGIVGERQEVSFRIVDESGAGEIDPDGETVAVVLSVDGKEIERQDVLPGEEASFGYDVAHGGANVVELEVEPREDELSVANNRTLFTTQGIRDRLRVLLISGEPHPGERTWRNLLKADSAVDLVHFTILRPPEKQDGTPIDELSLIAFPTRELFSVKLNEFDLIVFDRYSRRGILPLIYYDNIVQYVRDGGAVLIAAGPSFATERSIYRSPLSSIIPAAPTGEIFEEPYRPAITSLGRRHPVTRQLPGGEGETPRWGRWFRLVGAEVDRGEVVMSGPDEQPLMVLNREDEGRIALLLSDHAWLWARGYEGGGPQAELLRRLAHWLMKEPELEEESLSAELTGTRLEITRRTIRDSVEPVVVTAPDGTKSTVTLAEQSPGLWQATVEAETPGIYRLNSGDYSAVAATGALRARELADVIASSRVLEPVVDSSGGGFYWTGTRSPEGVDMPSIRFVREGRVASGSDWLGLRLREAYVVTGTSSFPLMTGILAAAVILAAIGFAWYREGR